MLARRLRGVFELVATRTEKHAPDAIADLAVHYDLSGNSDKAYQFALLAADRAKTSPSHQDSTDFIRIAERNAGSPRQLAEARVRMAHVAEAQGKYDEAEKLAGMAADFFIQDGDRRHALSMRRMRERLRALRGQSARRTLGACMILAEEARELNDDAERSALATMMSQYHSRLGERESAENMAREALRLAEKINDQVLMADALNRLANVYETPEKAMPMYERALDLYQQAGDMRGQARCHINLGVAHMVRGDWDQTAKALNTALTLSRTLGMRDPWGAAAINLGAMYLKRGNFAKAREMMSEALAIFSSLGHRERQLYALYNLANLDREMGENATGEELYDIASSMAQEVGQEDVRLGAAAGRGLARLAAGNVDGARAALTICEDFCNGRADWFQGREMLETLRVRMAAADGDREKALKHFNESLKLAEGSDEYGAMFMVAECGKELMLHDKNGVQPTCEKHAERAKKVGYDRFVTRFAEIMKA
jgi:tetratricopeptide (TPR) repeat protein